jgi:hypothetical protein
MAPIDFIFTAPSYGRSIADDGWETIEPAHIELWKSATKHLATIEMPVKGDIYTTKIDWSPIQHRHERHYRAMQVLTSNKHRSAEPAYRTARFPRRPSKSRISVITPTNRYVESEHNIAWHVTECALNDVFLIMNVASPGCCDFYRATLSGKFNERDDQRDISISNIHFEGALLTFLDHGWPNIGALDLTQVIPWIRSVRNGTSQVSNNSMERVLFALLHLAHMERSPLIVIWIFYAFESLLQANVGENFGAIVRRLSLLLGATEKQKKTLRKGMRELYDLRSSIVHGGFQVAHPMHNEILDKRVEENFMRLIEATNFGLAVLVSAVQETVRRGWKSPRFEEVLDGEPI